MKQQYPTRGPGSWEPISAGLGKALERLADEYQKRTDEWSAARRHRRRGDSHEQPRGGSAEVKSARIADDR